MKPKYTYRLILNGNPYQIDGRGVDSLKLKSEADSGQVFHRKKLSGSILLKENDFDVLYSFEKSADRCLPAYLEIVQNCDNTLFWRGTFSMNDVKWNLSRCEATISVKPDDLYRLVLDYYGKEFNVLTVPSTEKVKVKLDFDEQFEFTTVGAPDQAPDIPDFDTWALFLEMDYWIDGTFLQKGKRNQTQIYFRLVTTREFINNEPQDLSRSGWQIVDEDITAQVAKYAKAPDLYNFVPYRFTTKSSFNRYPDLMIQNCDSAQPLPGFILIKNPQDDNGCFDLRSKINNDVWVKFQWEFGVFYFDRNRRLLDVIKYLLSVTCPEIEPINATEISEFFTSATNYVTGQNNAVKGLLIAQKSDILSWNSSEPATKGMLSLKSLLDDLKSMFDVYWFINAAGKFQLEHISYFENVGIFDLTQGEYAESLKGKKSYEYKTEEMPRFEKLTFAEALNEDFEQGTIEYAGACVNYEEGQDTREINVTKITTDLEYLLTSSGSSKTGFVLLQSDGANVPKEAGDITGVLFANGHLSAANLIKNYHTFNRVLITGQVNGKLSTFKTVRKSKKQTTLNVQVCCGTEVNPFFEFITNLGNGGKLIGSDLSLKTGVTALDIVFDVEGSGAFQPGRQFDDSFNDSWR